MDRDETFLIHDLAVLAARQHYSHGYVDFFDRMEVAWEAIAEAWCTGIDDRGDLIRIGLGAITAEVDARRKLYGLPDAGSRTGAKHATYWRGGGRLDSGQFEEALTDRLAVAEVFSALPEADRQILLAQAWGTPHGYSPSAWRGVLRRARWRARRLWYYPEIPPRHYQPARRGSALWAAIRRYRNGGTNG